MFLHFSPISCVSGDDGVAAMDRANPVAQVKRSPYFLALHAVSQSPLIMLDSDKVRFSQQIVGQAAMAAGRSMMRSHSLDLSIDATLVSRW